MGTNKKHKKGNGILYFLLILLLLIAGVSAFKIYTTLKNYHDSNALYSDMGDRYVSAVGGTGSDIPSDPEAAEAVSAENTESTEIAENSNLISVDFTSLKNENPDCIAWLYFENEDLSYPVMYSGDDSTYLHAAFDKSYAFAGCIFLEGQNNPDLNDCYMILYGHNMRNLSMFGKLKKYYREDGYYEDHQYFQLATENGTRRYRIFAYEIRDCNSSVYTIGYQHDEVFGDFLNEIAAQSLIHPDITVTKDDDIVALSTCTSGDNRFVVFGVRVE